MHKLHNPLLHSFKCPFRTFLCYSSSLSFFRLSNCTQIAVNHLIWIQITVFCSLLKCHYENKHTPSKQHSNNVRVRYFPNSTIQTDVFVLVVFGRSQSTSIFGMRRCSHSIYVFISLGFQPNCPLRSYDNYLVRMQQYGRLKNRKYGLGCSSAAHSIWLVHSPMGFDEFIGLIPFDCTQTTIITHLNSLDRP